MNRNKITWIENLRALACITVIILHLSGPWLYKLHGVNIAVWNVVAAIHSITRFCVPVFLMITGALTLNKTYNTLEFYKNKLSRVVGPLLFWSVFYIVLFVSFNIYSGKSYSITDVVILTINSLKFGAAYHLWYLYLILILYLLIPVLSKFYLRLNQNQIEIVLLIWILILVSAQFIENISVLYNLRIVVGYFGYLILGSYLYEKDISKRIYFYFALMSVFVGFVFTFYPVYSNYIQYEVVVSQWFYYLNINVVLISIGIFLLLKKLSFESVILIKIAKHSFGIYFIHLFYIMLTNKITIPMQFSNLPLQLLFQSLFVLILSYISIILFLKIPFINKYIE